MDRPTGSNCVGQTVQIETASAVLEGELHLSEGSKGLVVFVHGSGSSRFSPRNQFVAKTIREGGLGTLLFDLLTSEEEQLDVRTRHLRFDIDLLAGRTVGATDWLMQQPYAPDLRLGYFGSSTGAAAALIAAVHRPDTARAVVSRGGRPDLARAVLAQVTLPVLLIVGGLDTPVIELNQEALAQMPAQAEKRLVIVPGATHLFEQPGALDRVAQLARQWFERHMV